MFRALSTLEETLNGMRAMESGHLRLAVCSTGKYFAPRMLGAFIQRYPGVDASLQIHNRKTLIERLANNEDDLYIFADPPEREDVVTQALLPNPLVVFARDDHPLAQARKTSPSSASPREPFLMREPGSGTRMLAMKLFEQRGLSPKIRMELSTNEAIKEAILAGLGVSIMSRYHARAGTRAFAADVPGRRRLSAGEPLALRLSGGQAAVGDGAGVHGFRAASKPRDWWRRASSSSGNRRVRLPCVLSGLVKVSGLNPSHDFAKLEVPASQETGVCNATR